MFFTGGVLAQKPLGSCQFEVKYKSLDVDGNTVMRDYSCPRASKIGGYCIVHAKIDGKKGGDLDQILRTQGPNQLQIGVYASGCQAEGGIFASYDYSISDFSKSKFSNMDASSHSFYGTKFDSAELTNIDFNYSFFNWASLKNAKIVNCKFQRAWLHEANFEGASIENGFFPEAKFIGTNLKNVHFKWPLIEAGSLDKAKGLETIDWGDFKVNQEKFGRYDMAVNVYSYLSTLYQSLGKADYAGIFADRADEMRALLNKEEAKSNKGSMPPWVWALISAGVVLFLALGLTFLRRKKDVHSA